MTWTYRSTLLTVALLGASVLSARVAQAQQSASPPAATPANNSQPADPQRLADLGYAPASYARTNYQLLQTRLKSAQQELDVAKARYRSGQTTQSEVAKAEDLVNQLTIEFAKANTDLKVSEFRAKLQQPIHIELQQISVQQCAKMLANSTGLSITVDDSVPLNASTTLSLDAQQVPLANVLEAIADKTDLMIAPGSDGVILKKWPQLNGRVFRSPIAPWSQEWGVPPTMNAGRQFGGFPGGGGVGEPVGQVGDPNRHFAGNAPGQFGNPGQPGPFGMEPQGFPPFALTNLGDHLIAIAEPGQDRNGNPGIWITAYIFNATSNQFSRMSSIFHPLRANGMIGPRPGPGDGRGPAGNGLPPGNNFEGSEKRIPDGLPGSPGAAPAPGGEGAPATRPAPQNKTRPPKSEAAQNQALLNAIKKNDTAVVRNLLLQGANPNTRLPHDPAVKEKSQQIRPGDELPALAVAINANRESEPLVNSLLDQGADPNLRFNEGGTPLMEAACRGNTGIVQALLDRGGDINARANDGATALMYAARFGQANTARLLMEKGANVNAQRDGGTTALMDAIAFGDYVEVVKALLAVKGIEVNAQDKEGYTALDVANKYERTQMIALLKKAGAKQNKPTPKPDHRRFFGEGLAARSF